MNLRQLLKEDFGIEVLVEGGSGLRDDPFVIEPCSAMNATRTQLDLLRGLERGRGELWRLVQMEPVAPAIQRLRIKTVLFTRDQIIDDTRAYYFDVNRVDGVPDASTPLVEWTDPRTTFCAVYQIGWLHFDRAINNSQNKDALDVTLQYSSVGAKAAIYVFACANSSMVELAPAERRANELAMVRDQLQATHPDAESPWPVFTVGPLALQVFLLGEELTIAGIALLGPQFLKLRMTFFDDPRMRDLAQETIQELAGFTQLSELGPSGTSDPRH